MSVSQDDLVSVSHVGEGVEEVGGDDVGDSLQQAHVEVNLVSGVFYRPRAGMNGRLRIDANGLCSKSSVGLMSPIFAEVSASVCTGTHFKCYR